MVEFYPKVGDIVYFSCGGRATIAGIERCINNTLLIRFVGGPGYFTFDEESGNSNSCNIFDIVRIERPRKTLAQLVEAEDLRENMRFTNIAYKITIVRSSLGWYFYYDNNSERLRKLSAENINLNEYTLID